MLRIVTDSSSEISQEEAARLGIEVLPLTIIFGSEQFRDGIDINSEQFYNKLVSSSEFPHTAQLGYDELMGVFGDAKAKGDEVLVIPIASALSGSFEWAERAAAESGYDKIKVYDSKCTTFMLEILVREAVRLKERPVEEVIAALDELRPARGARYPRIFEARRQNQQDGGNRRQYAQNKACHNRQRRVQGGTHSQEHRNERRSQIHFRTLSCR